MECVGLSEPGVDLLVEWEGAVVEGACVGQGIPVVVPARVLEAGCRALIGRQVQLRAEGQLGQRSPLLVTEAEGGPLDVFVPGLEGSGRVVEPAVVERLQGRRSLEEVGGAAVEIAELVRSRRSQVGALRPAHQVVAGPVQPAAGRLDERVAAQAVVGVAGLPVQSDAGQRFEDLGVEAAQERAPADGGAERLVEPFDDLAQHPLDGVFSTDEARDVVFGEGIAGSLALQPGLAGHLRDQGVAFRQARVDGLAIGRVLHAHGEQERVGLGALQGLHLLATHAVPHVADDLPRADYHPQAGDGLAGAGQCAPEPFAVVLDGAVLEYLVGVEGQHQPAGAGAAQAVEPGGRQAVAVLAFQGAHRLRQVEGHLLLVALAVPLHLAGADLHPPARQIGRVVGGLATVCLVVGRRQVRTEAGVLQDAIEQGPVVGARRVKLQVNDGVGDALRPAEAVLDVVNEGRLAVAGEAVEGQNPGGVAVPERLDGSDRGLPVLKVGETFGWHGSGHLLLVVFAVVLDLPARGAARHLLLVALPVDLELLGPGRRLLGFRAHVEAAERAGAFDVDLAGPPLAVPDDDDGQDDQGDDGDCHDCQRIHDSPSILWACDSGCMSRQRSQQTNMDPPTCGDRGLAAGRRRLPVPLYTSRPPMGRGGFYFGSR